MQALKMIGCEVLALFVEDARFTATLALWIALTAVLSRWAALDPLLGALALFGGLVLILIENLVHAARRQGGA